MESPAPTPQQLYARLKEISGAGSDEDLAHELEIKIRTLTRLKAGKTVNFETTVYLLDKAGWLRRDDATANEQARTRRVEGLARRAEAALEAMRSS
jgi:hypothetical protein